MVILSKSPYLTKQNLALALQKKPEAVSYFIKQALKKEELIAIKKGFFAAPAYVAVVITNSEEKEKYLEYLSNVLREPSYVSLEYILSKTGFIPENTTMVTAVSIKTSRVFRSKLADFSYRQINSKIFFGYDIMSFKDKTVKAAGLSKALFDFLYLRKFTGIADIRNYLSDSGRFNWEIFSEDDKKKFAEYAKQSKSKKMILIARQIKKYGHSR